MREAGFDVPLGEERLERAVEQGAQLARKLGRLPKFADWASARKQDDALLTEWQVYRMFDARRGAWSTFQFLVRSGWTRQGVPVGRTAGCEKRPKRQCRERGEAGEALLRCTNGRQRASSVYSRSGGMSSGRRRAVAQLEERALDDLALAQLHVDVLLDHLERDARRGEEELVLAGADPERPARAAGGVDGARDALVEPRRGERAAQLLEGRAGRPCECAARRRWSRSRRSCGLGARDSCGGASSSSSLRMIPLWMPTTGPCRTGWLLAAIDGWPFV